MRRFRLFLVLSLPTCAGAVFLALVMGSLLQSDAALVAGALLAGAGISYGALRLAVRSGLVPRQRFRAVLTGALVGLAVAILLGVVTLFTFIGPLLSFAFVGVGAVIADIDAAASEQRALAPPVT